MKFVRTLWTKEDRIDKVNKDITKQLNHKYPLDFTCFTYGAKNHNNLIEQGVKSILVSPYNRMFPPESEFGHKIYAWVEASKRFDKFVFLDWDVFLMKPLPPNFDDSLKGKHFQGNLRIYHNPKCRWTKHHRRKVPCASWMFFGDKLIPERIYKIWKYELKQSWREEIAVRKYLDSLCPKKILDLAYYEKYFESEHFCLRNSSVFKRNRNTLFQHFSGNRRD